MDIGEGLKTRLHGLARLGRAVGFVWQGGPGWTVASALLLIVQGVLPLATLYLIKLVIDDVTRSLTLPHRLSAMPHLIALVGWAGAVALLSAVLTSVSGFIGETQAQLVTDRMQKMLHAKSVEADLEYYENAGFYDTLHRAQAEAPFRPTRVVNSLMQIGQNAASLVAVGGLLLFSLHWTFALVLVVASVPGLLIKLIFTNKLFQLRRQQTAAERQIMFFNWVLMSEAYAKEVRLFRLGQFFMGRAEGLRRGLRKQKLQISARRTLGDVVTQASATIAIFGLFAVLASRTLEGAFTVGTMIMYYQAFQRGQAALQNVLGAMNDLYENNLFLSGLYEFLDLVPRVASPAVPRAVPSPVQRGVAFENVGFGYGDDKAVLEGVSFTIRPGETVALVGENGSGKTTLIKLLCRLYDPTQGRITIDGIDVRDMDVEAWRRAVSVVFQDYAHYPMTARENIWLGNTDLAQSDERIEIAARMSGAHEVIAPLKHGYDTVLGNTFNDGVELSIGQWQKVAIARAFLRDAQIVILDEPTSALDAEAEHDVFQKFRALAHGKTTILISHRLSTVRSADRIVVLQHGRIVEDGTHDELVEREGGYARMFMLQAQHYQAAP